MSAPNYEKIGVAALPAMFGRTSSFEQRVEQLAEIGFQTEIVDSYQGQNFRPPFFLPLVFGNPGRRRRNLAELAQRFDNSVVLRNINQATKNLSRRGSERVFLLGSSFGAVEALLAAQRRTDLAGVVGWYPHLRFPEEYMTKTPPDLKQIEAPILLFYGLRDGEIEPGTIDLARQSVIGQAENSVIVYDNVGHGFLEKHVQRVSVLGKNIDLPSPLYNRAKATQSWDKAVEWMTSVST